MIGSSYSFYILCPVSRCSSYDWLNPLNLMLLSGNQWKKWNMLSSIHETK